MLDKKLVCFYSIYCWCIFLSSSKWLLIRSALESSIWRWLVRENILVMGYFCMDNDSLEMFLFWYLGQRIFCFRYGLEIVSIIHFLTAFKTLQHFFIKKTSVLLLGSTDFGNVTFVVPGIHPYFYIGSDALNHTEQYTEAAGEWKWKGFEVYIWNLYTL